MTNLEKLRETFPKTIFIFRKNGNDEMAAIMCSDEWLQGDYDRMYKGSEPCKDAVSREAVFNQIFYSTDNSGDVVLGSTLRERIKSLPPVTPKQDWIPVNERLPRDLEPVNITWVNHDPEPYYNDIKDKPFTATGVYFNGQWYWWSTLCTDTLAEYSHNYSDIIDEAIEITAWMPLPESYKEGESE